MSLPLDGITRRQLLVGSASATAALAAGPLLASAPPTPRPPGRVWDCHVHLTGVEGTPEERVRQLLKYADRVGVDRLVLSLGCTIQPDPSPEQLRQANDEVLRAMRVAPDRLFGYAYLNPRHGEASLHELDRCVRDGPMVGAKLLTAVACNDRRLGPLLQRLAELKGVLLQHTFFHAGGNAPNESTPAQLAELAARHPSVPMIGAHAGGDWEQGVRAVRSRPNVCVDLSGSDPCAGIADTAVRELGVERVVWGSDAGGRSFASQLGKVLGSELSEAEKRQVLGANLERLLTPVLAMKGNKR
jgi:predicted TIM-barrel fold metal-dependent hydrolase